MSTGERPIGSPLVEESRPRIIFENGVVAEVVGREVVVVDWGEVDNREEILEGLRIGWTHIVRNLCAGRLPVHASSVVIDRRGYFLAGVSGAGKSTTMMALGDRGHEILNDEVCVLSVEDKSGQSPAVKLLPFARPTSLHLSSLELLGRDQSGWLPSSSDPQEGWLRGRAKLPASVSLDSALILTVSDEVERVETKRLSTFESFRAIMYHSNMFGLSRALLGRSGFMSLVSSVVNSVPVVQISRPADANSLGDVVEAIESMAMAK